MATTKILVIGETCIDEFTYCQTNRLSPEAPVPVLIPIETKTNKGMSGNVYENLLSLNKDIKVSQWNQEELIIKTRFIDKKSNHMFLRIDEGETTITPLDLTDDKLNKISTYDIVIVSDYDKGFITNLDLILIGKKAKLSILDTKKVINDDIIKNFSFIKLNEIEYKNNNLTNLDNIIVTLGSKGCMFGNKIYSSPNPQETIDVSGAGDTFTASFILKYFETKSIDESIIFANEMASLVVSKRGVVTPY